MRYLSARLHINLRDYILINNNSVSLHIQQFKCPSTPKPSNYSVIQACRSIKSHSYSNGGLLLLFTNQVLIAPNSLSLNNFCLIQHPKRPFLNNDLHRSVLRGFAITLQTLPQTTLKNSFYYHF